MKKVAVFALAACVVAPAIAGAQTPGQPSDQTGQQGQSGQPSGQPAQSAAPGSTSGMSSQPGLQIQSKSLVGSSVRNREGKDIGKVTNLLIEPSQGRVNGVVMSMGGTAGFGAQEITVPWSALKLARDGQNVVVTLQQDLLQPAPRADDRKNGSEGSASPNSQERRR
jgi:sporulation protein YlmC with PRC-barrel domain